MGLDVYAVRSGDPAVTGHATLVKPVAWQWGLPEDLAPFKDIPREFPEGLFWPSDGDFTGFRGQVYQDWVEARLGESLYELHDPAEVAGLADRLDRWLDEARASGTTEFELYEGRTVPLVAIEVLARFVRAAADQGLWLFPDY
jgi:hypothetical protein